MAKQNDEESKMDCTVLVLGGCGFIGRHLVQSLVARGNIGVRVADKLIPQTSYMTKDMMNLYKHNNVQLIQSDLSKDHHIQKVFAQPVDYIINLCGETRFGQSDQDYEIKILKTAQKCLEATSNMKSFKLWIEVSSAQIYEPQKKPVNEKGKIAPFTKLAEYRYKVEELVKKSKVPYCILRPSVVYGPGDKTGIVPRMVCAICYKHTKEQCKFLWTPNLAVNTVHVRDVCAAIYECCKKAKVGSIYNLSDKGNTTQGKLNPIFEKLFQIKCGFQNKAANLAAKKMIAQVAQYSNDKHVPMWSDLCKKQKITSSPLTPYIDMEILTKNYLCIDGTLIEKQLKFKYKYPQINEMYLQEVIDEYTRQEYFPDLNKMK